MPQLDIVCNLAISFNVDNSWMSWALDIETILAILVESNFSWTGTSIIGKFISSSFCEYVERPNQSSYTSYAII
jgi:hypothetical protein